MPELIPSVSNTDELGAPRKSTNSASGRGRQRVRTWTSAALLSLLILGALMAWRGGTAVAVGDTWFQTGNYWRTDPYGTDFYAQQAMWYDPYTSPSFGPGLYITRTYLRMDVVYNNPAEFLNCEANDVSGSFGATWERNWYNSPFPLNYANTPAWDYFTHNGVRIFTASSQFGASRNELCNLSASVPVGAWWSKSTAGGAFSEGAW